MTENEAIKRVKEFGLYHAIGDLPHSAFTVKAFEMAIKALEEIQRYRAIGTVERYQQLSEQFKPYVMDKTSCPHRGCNKCDKYRKENEKYHLIGTVEECREARERQEGKEPIKYGDTRQGLDNDGNSISWQEDCYECPVCESFLGYVSDCEDENYQDNYCRCCGQKLNWSSS